MKSRRKSWGERVTRPSSIQTFFIICSGANREILVQCPTEYNKYAGIGATIFFTALLASFSGGYALYTAFFDSINAPLTIGVVLTSTIFGIVWGFVIFNLDRYIVLSLRKDRIPTLTEIEKAQSEQKKTELFLERKRLIWSQALMASPRFLIALIIALTISKPIELRLFSSRIEKELARTTQLDISGFDDTFNTEVGNLNNQIQALNEKEKNEKERVFSSNPVYNDYKKKYADLEVQILDKERGINEKERIANSNRYLSTGYRREFNQATQSYADVEYKFWAYNNIGRRALSDRERLIREKNALQGEYNSLKTNLANLENGFGTQVENIAKQYELQRQPILAQIEDIKASYGGRKSEWIAKSQRSSDLLSRMEALGTLSDFPNIVWLASVVITMLFILLETAPVVVKLLTKRGPYDEIIERVEYEFYIEEQEVISSYNLKINELLDKAREASKLEGEMFIKV